jgi:hypothetical protein
LSSRAEDAGIFLDGISERKTETGYMRRTRRTRKPTAGDAEESDSRKRATAADITAISAALESGDTSGSVVSAVMVFLRKKENIQYPLVMTADTTSVFCEGTDCGNLLL